VKTLIVYASKYGCTADCAEYLKVNLSGDVTVADINESNEQLEPYDTIIIGGSVYIGKISKRLRAFCEKNLEILLTKRVGIFLCCALVEEADKVLAENFPPTLLTGAKTVQIFGSEARLEKMSFRDKLLIKAVTKGDFSCFVISNEKREAFIKEIS